MQKISPSEFQQLFNSHVSELPFCRVKVDSRRLAKQPNNQIEYFNFEYYNGKAYTPLVLSIKKTPLYGGVRVTTNLRFSVMPYISLRNSSCDSNGNYGEVLKLIETLYMKALKTAIKSKQLDDGDILTFKQSIDKDGNELDDDIYRIKLRANQSGHFTFPIYQIEDKQLNQRDLTPSTIAGVVPKGCNAWFIINFSYVIKSKSGYSLSSCLREFVYKKSSTTNSELVEAADLSDDCE